MDEWLFRQAGAENAASPFAILVALCTMCGLLTAHGQELAQRPMETGVSSGIYERRLRLWPIMRGPTLQLVAAVFQTLVLCALDGIVGGASAQGPTSAAIAGRILDDRGRGLRGVAVVVTNQATGTSIAPNAIRPGYGAG